MRAKTEFPGLYKGLAVRRKRLGHINIWVLGCHSGAAGRVLAWRSDIAGSSALLEYAVLFCLMASWLDVDSRETRTMHVWDMGFFLFIAWPVIVPYYLVRTRGLKRALAIVFLATLVYFGAFVAGMAIFRTPR